MCTEMDFKTMLKDYSLTARVDRIDELSDNYALSDGETESAGYEKKEDKAYAIIDYKHTANLDKSSQIEQLMLYDYVIMHHSVDAKSDIGEPLYLKNLKGEKTDVFLILLGTSSSSNSYRYYRHNHNHNNHRHQNSYYRHHQIQRQNTNSLTYHQGSRNYSNDYHSNQALLTNNHHQRRHQS